MRLLLCEDDESIGKYICSSLEQKHFAVDVVVSGIEAYSAVLQNNYAIAVIDVMLPGQTGLELVAQLRGSGIQIPILMLSAKGTVADRIRGLEIGADDYLTKPFSLAELYARITTLLRRTSRSTTTNSELVFSDLRLDITSHRVFRGEIEIELQVKEYRLLEMMMRNSGRVVTKNLILENIWGYHFEPRTNVVDVLVCRLRAKIDLPGTSKLIRTLRGIGYSLRVE